MLSHETLVSYEQQPEYRFETSDKEWLVKLGCTWEEGQDQNRLATLNNYLADVTKYSGQNDTSANLYALNARMKFINLFSSIDAENFDKLVNRNDWELSFSSVIGTQRLLHRYGIDNLKAIDSFPEILSKKPGSVESKLDNLIKLRLDPVMVVNNDAFVLNFAPTTIRTRLRVFQSAAREWEVNNYKWAVNHFIEQYPDLLIHNASRNRVIIRILSNALEPGSRLSRRQILSLVRNNLESTLAGYLDIESYPVHPERIISGSSRYKHLGRAAMISTIDDPRYADDRAVKLYRRMISSTKKASSLKSSSPSR